MQEMLIALYQMQSRPKLRKKRPAMNEWEIIQIWILASLMAQASTKDSEAGGV